MSPQELMVNAIKIVEVALSSGDVASEGIATSLTASLNNAIEALSVGDVQAAENMIEAFINKIEAQAGKQITEETAAQMIEAARQIIDKIRS